MSFKELPDHQYYLDMSIIDKIKNNKNDSMFVVIQRAIELAQKEAWNEAVKFAAENAKIRFWDGHFKEGKELKHFQSGVNNLTVSKESILQHLVE